MAYILDDTEVNTSVYASLLRPARLRKPRRSVLAVRVKRLEATVQLLQERLTESAAPRNQAVQIVTEVVPVKAEGRAETSLHR